jgi:Family of unknown function (DUF6011)
MTEQLTFDDGDPMTSQLDDPLDRTLEEGAADRERAALLKARVMGRTWQEVPKGYYAIPVHDWLEWMDRDCEGEANVIAYRMFSRTEARTCKTGRVIGKNRFITGAVWILPGADPRRVRDEIDGDDQMVREWVGQGGHIKQIVDTILLDIADQDSFRAQYGRITGRCGHCRKALTDPKSKLIGIGPDCRGYR